MSADELGRILGWNQTRVSRTENGGRRVSVAEAVRWADATSAPPDLREEVVGLAEAAARDVRSWWSVHAGGMSGRQHEIAALEASATLICNFQLIVPGILQTADYARHVMTLADVSGQGDIAAAVAARMRRQDALYQAKRFDYVLPEAALRARPANDPALMRAQADRLLSVNTLPNVSIAILPFSAPLPTLPTGGFVIYEIPGESLVVIETLTDELVLGDDRELDAYREAFARMRAASVTGDAASSLIRSSMTSRDLP